MNTVYIPHSQIKEIKLGVDTSSSNASDVIIIETIPGEKYWTTEPFTTDANGITGKFEY